MGQVPQEGFQLWGLWTPPCPRGLWSQTLTQRAFSYCNLKRLELEGLSSSKIQSLLLWHSPWRDQPFPWNVLCAGRSCSSRDPQPSPHPYSESRASRPPPQPSRPHGPTSAWRPPRPPGRGGGALSAAVARTSTGPPARASRGPAPGGPAAGGRVGEPGELQGSRSGVRSAGRGWRCPDPGKPGASFLPLTLLSISVRSLSRIFCQSCSCPLILATSSCIMWFSCSVVASNWTRLTLAARALLSAFCQQRGQRGPWRGGHLCGVRPGAEPTPTPAWAPLHS